MLAFLSDHTAQPITALGPFHSARSSALEVHQMTSVKVFAMLLVFVVFGLPQALLGQTAETGALSGTVSDSTGAVLSGANLRVTNTATGENRQAVSQDNGRYTVPLLPPGTYSVESAKSGFGTVVNSAVRINVAETARLDIVMRVGEVV